MLKLTIGFKRDLTDFNLKDNKGNEYIKADRFDYVILEQPNSIIFNKFDLALNYANWPKGRLFGNSCDLHWETIHDKKHAVVICEAGMPDNFEEFKSFKLISKVARLRRIFLWGEKQYDKTNTPLQQWYEPKIPQILTYPFANNLPKHQAILAIQEYVIEEKIDDECVSSTIHRYVDIEEV